jgi:hypothetical protein
MVSKARLTLNAGTATKFSQQEFTLCISTEEDFLVDMDVDIYVSSVNTSTKVELSVELLLKVPQIYVSVMGEATGVHILTRTEFSVKQLLEVLQIVAFFTVEGSDVNMSPKVETGVEAELKAPEVYV